MTEKDTRAGLRQQVRDKYAVAAMAVLSGAIASCCGGAYCDDDTSARL